MNTAIETYINSLFSPLPRTPDLERARLELLEMSEDKYEELIISGVSENEATGQVITEFGNLDEVADALGIRAALDEAHNREQVDWIGEDDAEHALRSNRQASYLITGGIFVILFALAAIAALSPEQANPWAAVGLFPAAAVATGVFIAATVVNRPASRITNNEVRLNWNSVPRYQTKYDQETWRFAIGLIAGIALVLLSLSLTVVARDVYSEHRYSGSVFLATVGVGIGILVITSMRRELLGHLARSDKAPSPVEINQERNAMRLGLIAPIYWPLVVVIYFAWSFLGDAWKISWIIWPVAGLLFGIIAAAMNAVSNWRGTSSVSN